jgi:hypothetical protein
MQNGNTDELVEPERLRTGKRAFDPGFVGSVFLLFIDS